MSRELSDISYVNLEFSSTSISNSWIMFDNFIYVIDSTPAGTIGTATTDGSGNFSVIPSSALAEGSYSLTVTATDAANNVSGSSGAVSITVDTTAPAQPSIST